MLSLISRFMGMPPSRRLDGWQDSLFMLLSVVLVAMVFYEAAPTYFGAIPTKYGRGLFLLLVYAMALMRYPVTASVTVPRVPWYDWLLITVSSAAISYWIVAFDDLIIRAGAPNDADLVFGSITMAMSLEVSRRALGWAITSVAILALLYGLFGDHFPIESFSHSGLSWDTLISGLYSLNGIFGFVLDVVMRFVVMFVIVGAMLQAFGAGVLMVELPFAIFGRIRGGPGIGAVAGSTLFGMISGSATANVAAVGTFTIPVMKRAGYPPHVAGAIEPAASTGGLFMPPVMGAGAFIMADITGVPYAHIAAVGLAPALIYFFSVAVSCYTEAGRLGLQPLPASERPAIGPILKAGWHYFLPIILLIWMMIGGYTAQRAAFWAVVLTLALSVAMRFLRRRPDVSSGVIVRASVRDVVGGIRHSANAGLVVGALTGSIGIIVSVVFQTGVGFMVTSAFVDLTTGTIWVAILISLLMAYILGMGVPVTAVYILMAVLFGPALKATGIDLLSAHMMLFWFSAISEISPPVALAAFVGAGIAGSDPLKTCMCAFRYAMFLFIMPILFIYTPILMPKGFTWQVAVVIGCTFLSAIPFAAGFSGFLLRRMVGWERAAMLAAAGGLIYPQLYANIVGAAVMAVMLIYQLRGSSAPAPVVTGT